MKTTISGKLLNGRLAVLGAGKIGGILLRAFLEQKLVQPKRVHATVRHAEKARALAKQLGIEASTDNRAAVRGADIVLLAVKPQAVREVLEEIKPEMKPGKLIVSVVASVPTQLMEKYLGLDAPVVRAMTNTPCAIGCGMTGLAKGVHAGKEHLEIAQAMFEAVGRVVVVDEKLIDAVTGLSASGTAFIYIILESLAEGGVKVGLPRDIYITCSADHDGRGAHGARQWRSARSAQGRRNHTRGIDDGRNPRAGGRESARDPDQGGHEGDAARKRIAAGFLARENSRWFRPDVQDWTR